jgi:hypothetical protein
LGGQAAVCHTTPKPSGFGKALALVFSQPNLVETAGFLLKSGADRSSNLKPPRCTSLHAIKHDANKKWRSI